MHLVLAATIVMASLGIFFGIVLAFFSKVFSAKKSGNALAEEILKVLPHVNCGACGYPSCEQFANAVANGDAKYDGCKVGRAPVAEKVKAILDKN